MSSSVRMRVVFAFLAIACSVLAGVPAMAQEQEAKQTFDVKGEYVRLVYNDEGWVVLGYRVANGSVGEEWLLLEVGVTLREGVKDQKLVRASLTVTTPDGASIPLASQEEFSKASLRALDARANMIRDSINYFPLTADKPCRIGFFTDISEPARGMAYDEVELSWQRACVGRAYFTFLAASRTGSTS